MVAGHQIAMNFSALVFMVPLAVGMTATIRVGHYLGRGESGARPTGGAHGPGAERIFFLDHRHRTIVFRHGIVLIYNDDPAVTALAVHLLFYVAAYQLVDGLQMQASASCAATTTRGSSR